MSSQIQMSLLSGPWKGKGIFGQESQPHQWVGPDELRSIVPWQCPRASGTAAWGTSAQLQFLLCAMYSYLNDYSLES